MTYLIVIFHVDDSSKDIAGHFLFERALDGSKISIRIVDFGHHVAHRVDHCVVPLAVELEANWARLQCNITRALQILGDGHLARLLSLDAHFQRVISVFEGNDASTSFRAVSTPATGRPFGSSRPICTSTEAWSQ